MKTDLEVLMVLDSLKYKSKEADLTEDLSHFCKPTFYYTYYENRIVNFFQKTPIVGNFFSHVSYWIISLYAAINIFIYNKNYIYKVFINPIVAIFYCFLLRIFKKQEHIVIAGFLFEQKKNRLYFKMRKWFVNFCYKGVSSIVVYSKYEVQYYSIIFPLLATKFVFIRYGRDYDFFEKNTPTNQDNYIASGGVSNRDFNTLLNAFKLLKNDLPEVRCKIATKPNALSLQTKFENIDVIYGITLENFGSFLNNALYVIIPLANTLLSAGHMVLLEAMYYEKIILVTDISSVRDYVDQKLVYFYEPENPQDLATQIKYLYLNRNDNEVLQKATDAKNYYLLNYTFSSLLTRIVETLI